MEYKTSYVQLLKGNILKSQMGATTHIPKGLKECRFGDPWGALPLKASLDTDAALHLGRSALHEGWEGNNTAKAHLRIHNIHYTYIYIHTCLAFGSLRTKLFFKGSLTIDQNTWQSLFSTTKSLLQACGSATEGF